MSDKRPTTVITTPGGHTAELKTYLTGRESDEIQSVISQDLKMTLPTDGGTPEIKEINGTTAINKIRKTVECLLVRFDEVVEKPIEVLLDLPASEWDFIKKEVDKITDFQQAK